jgi:glycosyltransferase involved in cell wall biosynthesis
MNPMVSIIVPVYNVERYLERCIDSLLRQTLDDFEILLINDGSTDASLSIAERYAANYPTKIKLHSKPNGGLGDARNYGIERARGEFIGFIDSDDYVDPQMYQKMLKVALDDQCDVVMCDILYEWEGQERRMRAKGWRRAAHFDSKKMLFLSPLFAWNKLYHQRFFKEMKLRYPKALWYEDIPVTLPVFAKALNVGYVEEVLVHYLQRGTSIMAAVDSPKLRDIFSVLDQTLNYFKHEDLYDLFASELEYVALEQLILFGGFRFYRSSRSRELMIDALKFLNTKFPKWRKNPYVSTLPWQYRIYIATLSKRTIPLYQTIVRLKTKPLKGAT